MFFSLTGNAQQRKKKSKSKKQSLLKRAYHNLTARDNGYYNARLRLNDAIKKIEDEHKEDYEHILPIYKYTDGNHSSVGAKLDEAISKVSIVIDRHPYSRWVDDCYFLIGKAEYFKGNYTRSLEMMKYVATHYKEGVPPPYDPRSRTKKMKKKKYKPYDKQKALKEKEKLKKQAEKAKEAGASSGLLDFLKHGLVYNDALIWIIKDFISQKKYKDAQLLISITLADDQFPEYLRADLEALHAHLFFEQKNYTAAIKPLENAIFYTKKKKNKTRYQFILAQIYELEGNKQKAIDNYKKVLELSPEYEMAFYTKINIAKAYENNEENSSEAVIELLTKMLKDGKNKEFLDQIYYYLADIALKDNKQEQAKEYLSSSIEKSINNDNQKALSFLKLGEIAYDNNEYILAKINHDSTLVYLSKANQNYNSIKTRRDILAKISKEVIIIGREDTLQLLASLSKPAREEMINQMVEQKRKVEEEKMAKEAARQQQARNQQAITNTPSASTKKTDWYFYNEKAMSKGSRDFIKKWGDRNLENNWRRSAVLLNNQKIEEDDESEKNAKLEEMLAKYQKSIVSTIPLNTITLKRSKDKTINARYELAEIFKNEIQNDKKAIYEYETLLEKFPKNKYRPQCLFNLYLLYKRNNNTAKADEYKAIILKEYANSKYAEAINSPNYLSPEAKRKLNIENHYKQTYQLFRIDSFSKARANKLEADKLYPNNYLKPNYDFLEALIIGKQEDLYAYKGALKDVIHNYPKHDVKVKAKEMLDALNGNPTIKPKASLFKYKNEEEHYACILFKLLNPKSKKLVRNLSNYNTKYHRFNNYKISSSLLDFKTFIIIKKFNNGTKALEYLDEIKSVNVLFGKLNPNSYDIFVVSNENLKQLYKTRAVEEYQSFYNEYYNK